MRGLTKEQSKELREKVIEYRKAGHVARECSDHFGVSMDYVYGVCHGIDFPWKHDTETMRQAALQQARQRKPDESYAARMVAENTPGFEYVSGYSGSDGFVNLKCNECGTVFSRSFVSVRKKQATCPECEARRKAEDRVKKIQKREADKEHRQWLKELRKQSKQAELKICPVCNCIFTGRKTYCSDRCRNQNKWMMKEGYRHLFPLSEVFERDNGICYICGTECDWDDYEVKNGVKIYGNKYPSRDHIIPKSRGGANEWENIRLACRGCNSRKKDSPLVKIS